MRVTKKDLENIVERLNNLSKRNYFIDSSYGGHKLCVKCNDKGGLEWVTFSRHTAKELYSILSAMICYAREESI